MLGTGDGRTFTARDADPLHWGLLATWADAGDARAFERGPVAAAWGRLAQERLRLDLRPDRQPRPVERARALRRPRPRARRRARSPPSPGPGCARRGRRRFWSAVPPVSADLHRSPGLRAAVGIGEAPLGLQGTFSLWDDAERAARVRPPRRGPPRGRRPHAPRGLVRRGAVRALRRRRGRGHARRPGPARVTVTTTAWDRQSLGARRDDVLDVYADAMEVDRVSARSRRGILGVAPAAVRAAGGRGRAGRRARRHRVRLPRRARPVVARPGAGGDGRAAGAGVARGLVRGVRAARAAAAARHGRRAHAAARAAGRAPTRRRRCSRRRTTTPGPAGSTGPAAGATWSARCASPATRGPSPCSDCGSGPGRLASTE